MNTINAAVDWLAEHEFVGAALIIGFCVGALLALHAYMSGQVIREPDEHEKGLLQ